MTGAGLLLALACAPRLLRVENELLRMQNAELRSRIDAAERSARPSDFAAEVNGEVLRSYLGRVGHSNPEQGPGDLLTVPISGRNARFRVSVQHFPRERVLFIATHDYIRLEEVTSSNAMVLVLTQLAALNYDLLLGKFQLNPRSGEISLSVEINLDDGLGFATWSAAFAHLVRTADERYPDLMRAVQGQCL